jgi:hypothetical protein
MEIDTESTGTPTLNPLVLIVEDDLSTRLYRETAARRFPHG